MQLLSSKPIVRPPGDRVVFFDNLRYLFVFGVVIQHASMAYLPSTWWPVADTSNLFIGLFTGFFDGFLMPALFYIAGYFAIPSINNKTIPNFIKGKLKRLGIPWLVCTLFIGPVLPLVYHYTRNDLNSAVNYGQIWLTVMKKAPSFDVGLLPPMTEVMRNDLFYLRYMWFISLLMAFFLIFSLVYALKKSWFQPLDAPLKKTEPSILSTIKTILFVGTLTFVGSTLLIGLMFAMSSKVSDPEAWFTFGNIIQFRVSRIFLHAIYFILGILTYKHKWIQSGRLPGHHRTWLFTFFILLMAYYGAYFLMITGGSEGASKLFGMLFWFCLNFFTITAIGLSLSLGIQYLNQASRFDRTMASHSYNLYLSHYIFIIAFQLCLLMMPGIPVFLKFGLVSLLSICCGCLISHYLIKPHPLSTIGIVAGLSVIMVLFIHP